MTEGSDDERKNKSTQEYSVEINMDLPENTTRPEMSVNVRNKPLDKWDMDDVVNWAANILGNRSEAEKLRKQRVNGRSLSFMTKNDFKECGITVGDTVKLVNALNPIPQGLCVDTIEKSLEILQLYSKARRKFWPYEKSEMLQAKSDWEAYTSKLPWVGRNVDETEVKKLIKKNFDLLFANNRSINDIQKIKQYIFHPIITGAPGIGKTTFGEHYPSMVTSCIKCPCSYARACFSIVMTAPTPQDKERDSNILIGMRLFWYFFLSHSMCWVAFQDHCKLCHISDDLFSIVSVVKFILSQTKEKAMVIHIDEINSLMHCLPTKVEEVLQEIGRACYSLILDDIFLAPIITGTGTREELFDLYNYDLSSFHGMFLYLSIPKKEEIIESIFIDYVAKGKRNLITQNFRNCIEAVVPLWRAVDLLLREIGNMGMLVNENNPFAGFMEMRHQVDYIAIIMNIVKTLSLCYGLEKWNKNGIGKQFLILCLSGILFPVDTKICGFTLSQLERDYGITLEYHLNNVIETKMDSQKKCQESLTIVPQQGHAQSSARHKGHRKKKVQKGKKQSNIPLNFMQQIEPNKLLSYILSFLPPEKLPRLRTVCKYWNNIINDKITPYLKPRFATIEIPYVLVYEVNSNTTVQVINPQVHPWVSVQGFVKGIVFEDVDGISEELRSKAFKIIKKNELMLCEYYCGVFGREDTLRIKIKLPTKEKFIKSIQQFSHPSGEKKIKCFDFKEKMLPCMGESGNCIEYAWFDGYIINSGPHAPTADIIRVYSKSSIIVMKQTKHMAMKETKTRSEKEYATYVKTTIKKAYTVAVLTFSAIVDTLPSTEKDRFRLIFVFVCNWPLHDLIVKGYLQINDLPPDTLLYHSENLKHIYSNLFLMRSQPISISKEVMNKKYV